MRQGDGTDLLGPSDPRSASIGVIYVAPNDDRQSVLTAILTQDKLGFKQVIVVLPDQNKAFQRPIDFEGLKNMRRGLKAEIVFIAPSGPGPAEYARQRRFPVYISLEAFSQSIRLATAASRTTAGSSAKRGLFGLGRKQEITNGVPVATVSNSETPEVNASTLPKNGTTDSLTHSYPPDLEQEANGTKGKNGSNGKHANASDMASLAAGASLVAFGEGENRNQTLEQSAIDGDPQEHESLSVNGRSANELTESTPVESNESQSDAGPAIITFSTKTPRPKITRKFPVPPAEVAAVPVVAKEISSQQNGSVDTQKNKKNNTGKMAAAGSGAAVGLAATKTEGTVSGSGGQPPSGSAPGGPGGGVGGTSRGARILLAVLLGILTVLLIGGITVAALPGGFSNLPHVIPGATATATVTITPDSRNETNIYQIIGVTGTPNPNLRQVSARMISASSSSQSKTVQSSGSIPALQATGPLQFYNLATYPISVPSTLLTASNEVQVSFNGGFTVSPGSPITVTGFAVNKGASGNIALYSINQYCCVGGNNIHVKNTAAFSGGQNAVPNSVVQQSDINGAATQLIASLTPNAQAALQKGVHTGEQVVSNTLKCTPAVSANHPAGYHAPNVTVIVRVTCKEEVYNQTAALTMAANLLTKQASADLGPQYALTGNIVSEVTKVAVINTKGTLSILVRAEGVWVYQFSSSVLQGFANSIAGKGNQEATNYLMSQPGVKAVKIDNPNGDTMPDAAHIKFVIEAVPGAIGSPAPGPGTATPIPSGPTPVPSRTVTPPVKPTPTTTQGLGGS